MTDANSRTLDLLALNIVEERRHGAWATGARVDVTSWDWRRKPSRRVLGGKDGKPYSMVIGSDLIYAATPLETTTHLATAVRAALAPDGVAWLALEKRDDSVSERKAFLAALGVVGFHVVEVGILPDIGALREMLRACLKRCCSYH